MSTGLARSVQTRLVRHAQALGVDPNLILARYAIERLLYRLSRSQHAERFVRKSRLSTAPADLESAIAGIGAFVGPVLAALAHGKRFTGTWPPGGPWR